LKSTEHEISTARREVHERILKWRDLQATFMPSTQPHILSQSLCLVENETLFLPSHFSDVERENLGLLELARDEARLREGQSRGCIMSLRFIVKTVTMLQHERKANNTGIRPNTSACSKIHTVELLHNQLLLIYNSSCQALITLNNQKADERYPPLTLADLVRKPTGDKWQLNDTHRSEGAIWLLGTYDSAGSRGQGMLPSHLTDFD
jgi:hypothetical protein